MSKLSLEKTIYTLDQLIYVPAPQVAVAGRSNVGKSSLINCLAGRKKLAKISSTPGKTRSLNFYRVNPEGFYLVDLPGYGYARCSKTERASWAKLIERYMDGNDQLVAMAVLLDCRLEPQKLDMELVTYLKSRQLPILPVLTKSDKVKQSEREKRRRQWQGILGGARLPLAVSSKTGQGVDKLWTALREAVKPSE